MGPRVWQPDSFAYMMPLFCKLRQHNEDFYYLIDL